MSLRGRPNTSTTIQKHTTMSARFSRNRPMNQRVSSRFHYSRKNRREALPLAHKGPLGSIPTGATNFLATEDVKSRVFRSRAPVVRDHQLQGLTGKIAEKSSHAPRLSPQVFLRKTAAPAP